MCVWSICLHVWQLLAHKCREQRQRRFGIIFILTRKFVSKNITHHLIYTHTMCKAIKARIKMYVATHFESLYQRHTKGYSKDSTYTELNCNDTNTHTHTAKEMGRENERDCACVRKAPDERLYRVNLMWIISQNLYACNDSITITNDFIRLHEF